MHPAVTPLAKLVISALVSSPEPESQLMGDLQNEFGSLELISERMAFHHTRYYEREMGADLYRRMVSFKEPVPCDALVEVKGRTQALEDRFRSRDRGTKGHRRCNLDPGLLALNNFVLATHKGYTHRVYLGEGIYADLTLIFQHGSFRPLDWTYPDYASAPMIQVLNLIRRIFVWQRKQSMGARWDAL